MLESHIEETILQYLNYSGWLAWKNISSGNWDAKRKCYRKHKSKFAIPGVSDIIAIKNGRVLFLEVKTKAGRLLDSQIIFKRILQEKGGEYFIVRSVEDTMEIIGKPAARSCYG
jgi:hypothetical protein